MDNDNGSGTLVSIDPPYDIYATIVAVVIVIIVVTSV